MCQHRTCVVAPESNIGKGAISISETDLRKEIDARVYMKLTEREIFREQYQRGVSDAIYICFIIAAFAVGIYFQFYSKDVN